MYYFAPNCMFPARDQRRGSLSKRGRAKRCLPAHCGKTGGVGGRMGKEPAKATGTSDNGWRAGRGGDRGTVRPRLQVRQTVEPGHRNPPPHPPHPPHTIHQHPLGQRGEGWPEWPARPCKQSNLLEPGPSVRVGWGKVPRHTVPNHAPSIQCGDPGHRCGERRPGGHWPTQQKIKRKKIE